jgi:MoaA/NifB/PqqE/SkfB family radical SAM enzyme
MLSEEAREEGVQDGRLAEHEAAAHDRRNWVRLTYECNDRCIFCLDSDTHDGEMRDPEEVKAQILDGRRKGATRLILSGGEPTIHPRYVDFIKLGRLAGYPKVQTVTNGRMFRYPEFLKRCVDEGLGEITFSIHGPNARVHDALVGVKGAFEEEVQGLKNALEDGRVIVNIDVCVNRGNVKVLPEIIETFVAMGVREYDLLHVIPFGRAWREGQHTLFYDLEEAAPYLQKAFAWSREPDMHIWLNRFPPEHCEGFEDLIQDPYKLNDEVRGRKEEYERLLSRGEPLDCRAPERCRYCYLSRLCDTLDDVRETVHEERFEAVRLDAGWEAKQGPVYGGDPASARRAKQEEADRAAGGDGRVRLPLAKEAEPLPIVSAVDRARRAGAKTLVVVAKDVEEAREVTAPYDFAEEVEVELEDYRGLGERLGHLRVVRAVAATVAQAEMLLAIEGGFEVVVLLTRETAAWLSEGATPSRLVVRQPTYERLTQAGERDADLPAFFAGLDPAVVVEGVPACIAGRLPRPRPPTLDTTMMRPDGRLEIFRYAKRFIVDRYFVKSLRCKECVHEADCRGLHVNQVRAHGFAWLEPVKDPSEAAAE